jgi:gliding motility-associated-like protein
VKRFLALAVFSFLLLLCEGSFGQLSVSNCSSLGLTPAQLIQNWFVGSGVTISNATFNGSSSIISSKQPGSFVAGGNALIQMGIDSGMIMTSGIADTAIGPNGKCDAGMDVSGPGDADLTVIAGINTYDKCVIEFDFIPVSDTIRFRYVFGSEELFLYCYQFNDAFGFFLSGPGINGTFSNSSIDIALMPGSSNYVTINNCCSDSSSVWCNAPLVCGDSSRCHNSPENSGLYYQYNAMTYVFTAQHAVQPCYLYHIKLAVADAHDQILDSGVFLEKGSFSSSSVTGSSQVCENSSGNVYTTQPGMLNYQWMVSPGGTVTSGGTSISNWVTVTWNTVGHKTVTVNYTSPGGCSSAYPSRFDVTVNPLPVPVISGPSVLCADSAGNMYTTQTGMNNYSWTVTPGGTITGGGTSTSDFANVTWTTPGIQSVSVNYSDANGCSAANPTVYTVNVLPRPIPVISGDSAACIFSTVYSYTTEPGMNFYTWNISAGGVITSGTGTDSITVIWTVPGPQWVRVTYKSQNGCSAASPAQLNVGVMQIPYPAGNVQGPSEVCTGTAGIIYSVPLINDASVYVWSLPTGFNVVSGNGTNSIVVDLAADAVTGIITVYGSSLCGYGPVSPPFLVVVGIGAEASAGPDLTTCTGTPVTVTQASASNYSSVHWYTTGTGVLTNSTTLSPAYTPGPSELGNITMFLVASGNPPCGNDTSFLTLDILDIVMISAGPPQVSCDQRPFLVSGSQAVNFTSLLWTTSGNGTFDDPSIMHPVYSPSASDVASGQITLTFLGGSTPPCGPRSDTMMLTFIPGPSASPGPDGNICQGMSYKVHGVTLSHFSGFKWENNGQGELKDTGTLNPTYVPAPGELGEVQLVLYATGNSVCQDSSSRCYTTIFIYPDPDVVADEDQTIKYGASTTLTCEPTGGTGSFQYVWNPASLLLDNSLQDPKTVALVKDTVFIITVRDIVTGCEAADSVRVKIDVGDGTEDCFVIHNVITPNGDGLNDFLVIDCLGLYPYNHLDIYNRWGDRVNFFVNYNNADRVWKGTNTRGEILPDGTYYYVMTTKNGFTFTGWIYLRSGAK